jgi:hypothetical protein
MDQLSSAGCGWKAAVSYSASHPAQLTIDQGHQLLSARYRRRSSAQQRLSDCDEVSILFPEAFWFSRLILVSG